MFQSVSINHALNVLGLEAMPSESSILDKAYQESISCCQSLRGKQAKLLEELLHTAYLRLQNTWAEAQGSVASDPAYTQRFVQALRYVESTPLAFEILGSWLWVQPPQEGADLFEPKLRAHGFEWASRKACWFLKPKEQLKKRSHHWNFDRIRATYGQGRSAKPDAQEGAPSCL